MINNLRYISLLAVTVLLSSTAVPVHAQQSGAGMVEISQQLTRLEAEVRQLRGEVEKLSYENNRLKSQQNDFYVDLDGRIRKLESGAIAGSSSAPDSLSSPVGQSAINPPITRPTAGPAYTQMQSATPTAAENKPAAQMSDVASISTQKALPADPVQEKAHYKDAFDLLKLGRYKEAIPAFNQFLASYPSGEYASNAQYWLGEAHYVTREFEQAIAEFNKVITQYPQSRKVPDAMLKIGYIYYELNDSAAARQSLKTLIDKYPSTTAARLAGNRLQRMKLEGR